MRKYLFKYLFTLVLIISCFAAYSQQDPLFSQYMNNPGIINPAYAGYSRNINVNGIFRKQWLGMDWSPTTTTLSVNSPFRSYDVGLGLTFVNDQIGPLSQNGLYVDYSRHFILRKNRNIALGLKSGFNYFDINLANLQMNQYDPFIALNPYYKVLLPNFGIGLFYYTDNYYFGFSVPKLIRNSIKDSENTMIVLGREERHYFFTTGYLVDVSPVLKFRPSIMSRFVNGAPVSLDLSATAIVLDRLWFGLTYRYGDAVAAHARLQVNDQFQFGYSFDLNNSRLKGFNSGSHEIFLNYNFAFMGNRVMSPRYF
jgi:type IX secretion system PorP/SprF family membrane protein